MWKVIIILLLAIILLFWISSYGDWHVKRNRNNKLPVGQLKLVQGKQYKDERGLVWVLQPNANNIFHQPDITPVPPVSVPYPNITPPPEYDQDYPNLKFLSPGPKGDSYEAILQPDGTHLTTGAKQGTYNYGNPEGFWGYTKHTLLDVIPHLFNSNYHVN